VSVRRCVWLALAGWLAAAGGAGAADETGQAPLPRSPFLLRHALERTPPFLDAAPPCLPGASARELGELATRLRAGDSEGARRALRRAAHAQAAAAESADLRLVGAIVEARAAVGSERMAELRMLERALDAHPQPEARACARLERARILLQLRRPEEARVELARARRAQAGPTGPATDSPAARWLAAEAAHARGDDESAGALYAALAGADDTRIARAAGIRLVEQKFPVGGSAQREAAEAEWRRFPQALQEAAELGLGVEAFSLVAGELALRARDFGAAHHWLARAERAWPGGLAAIRKADALRGLGLREDARRTLERVARKGDTPEARALAELRLVDDRLAEGERDAALAALAVVARNPHPMLRALAHERLAAERLAAGELEHALPAAVRLAYDEAPAEAAAELTATVASVIAASAHERDCPLLLGRFGGRHELLVRSSRGPEALVAVGDCLLEIGLAEAALESYRAAGRVFGFDRTPDLALRIAEASLAHGDRSAVAAALAAEVGPRRPDDPTTPRWLALSARLALREGRREEAAALWLALLRSEALPPELRGAAESELAALALDGVAAGGALEALAASLEQPASSDPAARALVRLTHADLVRASGDGATAARGYREAASALPPGSARDRALHQAAELAGPGAARREVLGMLAAGEPASAWSRLSQLEQRLERIDAGGGPP
jgi:hypothetical protein